MKALDVSDVQRIRTEFVWKSPIRFSDKALRLKVSTVDNIHYCQLGKLAVVTVIHFFMEMKITEPASFLAKDNAEWSDFLFIPACNSPR